MYQIVGGLCIFNSFLTPTISLADKFLQYVRCVFLLQQTLQCNPSVVRTVSPYSRHFNGNVIIM